MPTQSDDWDGHWDAYARAAELNPAQSYRRHLIQFLLERRGAPRRLLDIGSGQGDFLLAASHRWPNVEMLGLEVSERGNRISKSKVPSAHFLDVDLTRPPGPAHDFIQWATHAVCSEVLEHVDDPIALLRNARRYLSPGARIVVTVPGGPMSAFDRSIGHRRHYTPGDLRAAFADAGLQTAMTGRAGFPFFNLYRHVVISRGERLAAEISASGGRPRFAARLAMRAFRPLLLFSLPRSGWGTQIVGVAYEPHPKDPPD
ncbi:MAG: class I SAM-dependent methyltransferase [Solirubrobacteraceae bacterium]